MALNKKLAVDSGAATGSLGILIYVAAVITERTSPLLLGDLLVLTMPGLLVALGSYVYAVKAKKWGAVLLAISGSFLAQQFFAVFFGLFYIFGLWIGVAMLVQSAIAIVTMVAAFDSPTK
jgi:hypothetical protein